MSSYLSNTTKSEGVVLTIEALGCTMFFSFLPIKRRYESEGLLVPFTSTSYSALYYPSCYYISDASLRGTDSAVLGARHLRSSLSSLHISASFTSSSSSSIGSCSRVQRIIGRGYRAAFSSFSFLLKHPGQSQTTASRW